MALPQSEYLSDGFAENAHLLLSLTRAQDRAVLERLDDEHAAGDTTLKIDPIA